MGGQVEGEQAVSSEGEAAAGRKRERTLIEFPYTDINRAADLASALATAGGKVWIDQIQLAVAMDMSAAGGTFRGRLSAARMFGFVETEGGKVRLSDLGLLLLDDQNNRGAMADAFLRVPLYKSMYDAYNGFALPPAAAVERQMMQLGVPPKQAERARQAFASSAQAAGYIAPNGRFSKPMIAPAPVREENGGSGGGGGGYMPPPPPPPSAPPPPPPPPPSAEKLEYKLVDLMSEAIEEPDVMNAIVKVITFLKAREAAKKTATDQ